jgi:hypothetical protein
MSISTGCRNLPVEKKQKSKRKGREETKNESRKNKGEETWKKKG